MPAPFQILKTPPRVALANFYPFAPNERAGPHWSESSLFLPCTQGHGEVRAGLQHFKLEAGDVLHVPWAAPIEYHAPARDPFVVIGVHLRYESWDAPEVPMPLHSNRSVDWTKSQMQSPPIAQPFRSPFVIKPPPGSRALETAVALAECFPLHSREDRAARLRALALEFFLDIQAALHRVEEPHPHPQSGAVHELLSWLEMVYPRKITREEMARRAGVSESTLASAFRAVTGKAPVDYLIDLRLEHAKRQLASGHDRVGAIAVRVGIPDLFYFSKLFKQRVGVSPLEFRKTRRL